jgi:hypothetical protein
MLLLPHAKTNPALARGPTIEFIGEQLVEAYRELHASDDGGPSSGAAPSDNPF